MKNTTKLLLMLLLVAAALLTVERQVSAEQPAGVSLPAPELYTPFDKATSEMDRPIFTWQHFPEADRYRWEIREKDSGITIKKAYYDAGVRCSGDTCSIPSPVVLANGAYKWHVVAIDDTGGYQMGTWSTYNVLYIGTEVYPRPGLRSPGQDAIVYGGRPTFKWYPIEGDYSDIDYAAIEVTDENGDLIGLWNAPVDNDTCSPYCEYRIPLNLGNVNNGNNGYGVYNWRVQVMNADKSKVSRYSPQRTFTYTQLDRVELISPADDLTTGDSTPVLSWSTVPGATYYILNVRTLGDVILTWDLVPASACEEDTCTAVPSESLADGEYKWHVRSKNGINYGRWTAYRNITVDTSGLIHYNFEFNDGVDPTTYGWVESDNTWYIFNQYYRGNEHETEEDSFYASTYYNHDFADAVFESRIQTSGDDADLGFTIIFRGQFDGTNHFDDGFIAKVIEDSEGIRVYFFRIENGLPAESLGEVIWSGDGGELPTPAGEWHVYRVEMFNDTMTFSIDGNEIHTLSGLSTSLSTGVFGLDIESSGEHNLYMFADWVHISEVAVP